MQIDDIKTGQYIIITGPANESRHECPPWPHVHEKPDKVLNLCGTPLEVVAINLPFVAVSIDDDPSFVIDARKYKFARANHRYVKAFGWSMYQQFENHHRAILPSATTQATVRACCPGCGGKMVERRIGESKWAFRCRECEPA